MFPREHMERAQRHEACSSGRGCSVEVFNYRRKTDMRKSLLIAATLAALAGMSAATTASADGICVCGMKRPLRADISDIVHRPLRVEGIVGGNKRPLRV